MSLFALLPTFLSIGAGRLIDRTGPQRPLEVSLGMLALATALPFAFPRLEVLYLSTTLLGVSFMYVHIAMNSVFGAHGSPEQRALNFSWLALGFSISNSVGPLVAGYAIDGLGLARAFAVLAVFPAVALALLGARKRPLPRPEHVPLAKRAACWISCASPDCARRSGSACCSPPAGISTPFSSRSTARASAFPPPPSA
jgi:MFS family permease